jgi:excisionase family DNA binding protein
LLSESGQSVTLPPVLNDLLTFLVETWDQGEATHVMAVNDVLTTAQVADLLNVSRPYVVKLIDEGLIVSHRVGTHRRVRVADALAYREAQDRVAEMALAEFHRIGAELNLPD